MDDNNKYNRNKDYEPDNFDDEVAFPARRNNAPERSSDIQEDYGDNFDNDVNLSVIMTKTPFRCRKSTLRTIWKLP